MSSHVVRWILLAPLLIAAPLASHANELLNERVDAFVRILRQSPNTDYQAGNFTQFDDTSCLENPETEACFGPNADTTYLYPNFDDGFLSDAPPQTTFPISQAWKWDHRHALVMLLELPPRADYVGFTPYLQTRYTNGSFPTITGSVGDTLNQLSLKYLGDGEEPFGQVTAIIASPDQVSAAKATDLLVASGYPRGRVNVVPYSDLPLQLGQADAADLYTLLLRVSGPQSEQAMTEYVDRRPLRSFFLTDLAQRPPSPFERREYTPRGAGFSEPDSLLQFRRELLALIENHYAERFEFRTITDELYRWDQIGHRCIDEVDLCAFDNPDSIYFKRIRFYRPGSDRDLVFIVGIRHDLLQKALYVNHNVANPSKQVSLASVNKGAFAGSVAFHTGLPEDDPLLERYHNLYIYAFAYDCDGLEFCLDIDTNDESDDPKAIDRDIGFDIATRLQLDPVTATGPLLEEIVPHRITIACSRSGTPQEREHCLTQPIR